MSKRDYIGAWLTDEYARLFLGLAPASETSRWVTVGERCEDELHVGFWIKVDRVEERRSSGKRVIYTVRPNMCLLTWNGIITIQNLKKGADPEIGIQP